MLTNKWTGRQTNRFFYSPTLRGYNNLIHLILYIPLEQWKFFKLNKRSQIKKQYLYFYKQIRLSKPAFIIAMSIAQDCGWIITNIMHLRLTHKHPRSWHAEQICKIITPLPLWCHSTIHPSSHKPRLVWWYKFTKFL